MSNYSELSKKELYQLFLKYEKSDFPDPTSFLTALVLGLKTNSLYQEFLESEFAQKDYRGGLKLDVETSKEFLQYKKTNFKTKDEDDDAKLNEFTDSDEYYEFKEGQFETRKNIFGIKMN